jgi:hypothetical protein
MKALSLLAAGTLTATLFALTGTAAMAAPPKTIIACYNKVTGRARIVNAIADCHADEDFVTWNEKGPAGPEGPAGAPGPEGPAGPKGAQGPEGLQGPAGAKGATGAAGPQGPAGATGAQGLQGLQGAAGPAGPTGSAGPAGAVGPQGLQGPAGPAGPIGSAGPAGAVGPQGLQGAAGPAGPAGPTGPAGPEGATGATGPSGTQNLFGTNALDFSAGEGGTAQCTIGSILLNVSFDYPENYLPADGRLLPIEQWTAVFSLLGTNYGGNGTTNFALPDLRAAAPNNTIYLICVTGIFP